MIIGDVNGQPQDLTVPTFPTDYCPSLFTVGDNDNATNGETDDCAFKTPTCGSVVYLCIDYLGDVFYNFGIAIIQAFTFIFAFIAYFVQLLIFIGKLVVRSLTPLEDAPWYVNILLLTPQTFLVALIGFTLVRSGDDGD